jgi:3-oxoacyl-[acyl-carrier-protein] synthase III
MGTCIEAASALTSHGLRKPTARRLADAAARTCLVHAGREPGDVDMLINAGIYREDSMGEPALAALIQEDIGASRPSEGTAPSRSTSSTASAG